MKKILCIDDSVNLLQTLKKRFELEIADLKVLGADNGPQGIELARKEKPDLIILDITMPGMDGYQVLHELKHPDKIAADEYSTVDIPVIILTSHGPEERGKYLQAGALDYISSPFDTVDLINRVKSLISK
jgi:CheY-like chemotaxis protein